MRWEQRPIGRQRRRTTRAAQPRGAPVSEPLLARSAAPGCACGGRCPACSAGGGLRVSQPGERLERDADRLAERVAGRAPGAPRRLPDARPGTGTAPAHLASMPSPGRALDATTRAYMEPRFGRSFADVRVHTDAESQHRARQVGARAYTIGSDIVFARDQHRPATAHGRRLLAHELAHVVQQRHGPAQLQRQDAGAGAASGAGAAPASGTPYYFSGCDGTQMPIMERTILQSYMMVRRAQTALLDYALAGIQAGASSRYTTNLNYTLLRDVLAREFGATTPEQVREIRWRYYLMERKMLAGLDIECHTDPARNQVAEAEMPGRRAWFGPKFFDEFDDELHSRPRVFIHELAHTVGIDHDSAGIRFNPDGTITEGAEFAHHADSYAILAYRLYTGNLTRQLVLDSDI